MSAAGDVDGLLHQGHGVGPSRQDEREDREKQRDDMDEGVDASLPDHSVVSNLSMSSSQTRARREERLQAMLRRAKELRADALRLVHRGGVDVVTQIAPLEDILPGRTALRRCGVAMRCCGDGCGVAATEPSPCLCPLRALGVLA